MKKFSPGASVKSDYYYICDMCEVDDGRAILLWNKLPRRRGYFALCYQCLAKLYLQEYIDKPINLTVVRAVIPERLRNKIFERDGYRCVNCGGTEDLQIDHIIPLSRGGETKESNLQTLCRGCNQNKGTSYAKGR